MSGITRCSIVESSETMTGTPHVENTNLTVEFIAECVEDRNIEPVIVAERNQIGVATVYRALARYHERR